MICQYAEACTGCSLWSLDYPSQLKIKTARLRELAQSLNFEGEINCYDLGPIRVRDRGDLQWRKGQGWGFVHAENGLVTPISQCLLFSESLNELYHWWARQSLEAEKASVRLRVSPDGRWGVWLDMANIDIKGLLSNGAILELWSQEAHIEIGQRHKVLKKVNSQWKLGASELYPWFQTSDLHGNKYHLFGSVASFSQVGFRINEILVHRVLAAVGDLAPESVIELGCGNGNFTLPLASHNFRVTALEQSEEAVLGLRKALEVYPAMAANVDVRIGNFRTFNWGPWIDKKSLLLLDPPRSGVGDNLLRQLSQVDVPFVVYVACGVEAWVQDAARLRELKYDLISLEWVDQFPNTLHFELISIWKKRA